MTVFVLGRFPPPIDGQTLATERLASLIERDIPLKRVDTEPSTDHDVSITARVRRAVQFLRLRSQIRSKLRYDSQGTVLWPAVSPDPLGHYRDLAVVLPSLGPRQKVFAIVHRGNFVHLFDSFPTSSTASQLVRRTHGFVFLTDHLSEQCARWIPKAKRHVIPNTIDERLIFSDSEIETKRRRRREKQRLSLLFIGHMLRSKGYLDVLESIKLLCEAGIAVEGQFIGGWTSDDDQVEFESLVRKYDLGGIVAHHGVISDRSTVRSLHENADVLLLPTYYRNEAQPLVILEAMNAGTPVVSTEHAGIPEMIRDKVDGLLVPQRDPGSLSRAVSQLNDHDLWESISTSARQRFISEFAPDVIRQSWLRLVMNELEPE